MTAPALRDVESARQFLNSHPARNPVRRVKQAHDAAHDWAGWHFAVWPFDSMGLHFIEARISNASRFIGCPNPPDAYLIHNGGKVTRVHDYGRALRLFAALVERHAPAGPPIPN